MVCPLRKVSRVRVAAHATASPCCHAHLPCRNEAAWNYFKDARRGSHMDSQTDSPRARLCKHCLDATTSPVVYAGCINVCQGEAAAASCLAGGLQEAKAKAGAREIGAAVVFWIQICARDTHDQWRCEDKLPEQEYVKESNTYHDRHLYP